MLELVWNVDEEFGGDDEIMLVAVVDSPQDPFAFTSQKVVDLANQTNNISYAVMNVAEPTTTGGCPLGCVSLR